MLLVCYSMNMREPFADMLLEGGHKNSLGRVNEIIELVLADKSRLEELYQAMFHEDAWARMRAADAFEKICRSHPEWIAPYVDRIQQELSSSEQASIQWHLAEIYMQVELDTRQKKHAIEWLKELLSTTDVDWIVAANSMKALVHFTAKGDFSKSDLLALLRIQQDHKSNAVKKRAAKLLAQFT